MTVKQLLPSVKAHKGIYHNLDAKTKQDYQKLYAYLVKHKDKDVWFITAHLDIQQITQPYGSFLYKYKRMEIISRHIKH